MTDPTQVRAALEPFARYAHQMREWIDTNQDAG